MVATSGLDLSVPATPLNVRTLRGRIAEIAAEAGATEQVVDDVRLCVSEAVTNAMVHAYGSRAGAVTVTASVVSDELTVVVSDEGKGLSDFHREGDIGYGLKIIERLTRRFAISSAPKMGTEVRMIFALHPRST